MERLEKENQELMTILLQMQALLQQQQQRNASLTQAVGFQASGNDQAVHAAPLLTPLTAAMPHLGGAATTPLLSATLPAGAPLISAPFPPAPLPVPAPLPAQVPSAQLPLGGSARGIASNAPVESSSGASGVHADKRKAEVLGQEFSTPVTPGAAAAGPPPDEVVNTGEPAPWKSQRKRQKRSRGDAGEATAGPSAEASQPAVAARRAAPPAPPPPPAPTAPATTSATQASAAKSRPGTHRRPGPPSPGPAGSAQGPGLAGYHQALLGV